MKPWAIQKFDKLSFIQNTLNSIRLNIKPGVHCQSLDIVIDNMHPARNDFLDIKHTINNGK